MSQKLETNQKSFVIFVNAIKSDKTKIGYIDDLKKFLAFTKMPDYDTLAKLDTDTIQEFLENYVIELKGRNLTSIRTRLAGPELFFEMNKKLFYKKILHKLLPSDDNPMSGSVAYTTEDIIKMLSCTFKPRTKAIIHLLASIGPRPGAFDDPPLQMKHLEKIEDCYSLKIYDGSKEGYFGYLIPEAVAVLDDYFTSRKLNGEKLTPESYIFHTYNTKTKKNEYLSSDGVRVIMKNLVKKAGIERNRTNTKNYDKAVIYGFRKRFYTTLKLNKDINNNVIEKLMSHKRGLEGTYLSGLTREQSFKEFKKGIADLTINPAKRQAKEIELQQEKITELSKRDERIGELENKQKDSKETLKILSRLYMLEATEPVIHTKEAYDEEDQFREELRNKLKKLIKTDELTLDF